MDDVTFKFSRKKLLNFIPIVQQTRCTCYLKLFILAKRYTCFGISVHHQELKTAYTATVYVKQLLLTAAIGDEMEKKHTHRFSRSVATRWHDTNRFSLIWLQQSFISIKYFRHILFNSCDSPYVCLYRWVKWSEYVHTDEVEHHNYLRNLKAGCKISECQFALVTKRRTVAPHIWRYPKRHLHYVTPVAPRILG